MENDFSQHDLQVEHHYSIFITDEENRELLVFQHLPKQEIRLFGNPISSQELVAILKALKDLSYERYI